MGSDQADQDDKCCAVAQNLPGGKTSFLASSREPRPGWLARCPTLEDWDLSVRTTLNSGRRIVISARLKSARFTVRADDVASVLVLWMDRRWKFVLTARGMMNLRDRVQDITERGPFTDDK